MSLRPKVIEESPSLLPVPPDVSHPNDKLCKTCQQLELDTRRFVVLEGDKEYGERNVPDKKFAQLGEVEDMRKKTNCPLCRLILEALGGDRLPTSEDGEPVCVSLSWNTDGPYPIPSQPWSHIPKIRIIRPYAQKKSGNWLRCSSLNLFPVITLLANDSPTDSRSFFVRPIDPDKIDFSVVRRWLSLCNEHHDTNCQINPGLIELGRLPQAIELPEFRCIDLDQNCLVIPDGDYRYATLSYVCGNSPIFTTTKANVADLERPGALAEPQYLDRIPLTIRDAMQVTRELGLRYLWVDSLCIVQDDESKRLGHIENMDVVYSAAEIVIIAAGSVDAHSGIAGIHPGTRLKRQPIVEIAPHFRLAFKTRWQDGIESCVYFKRAWTFQEEYLATRSLIFINGQVVFRCQYACDWEEHTFERETDILGSNTRGRAGYDDNDIGEFEGMIQSYSERLLTYETDIWNAFAGLARRLSVRLQTELCHGIPIAYFDWFLLWEPLTDQVRRTNAPSWSWGGWIGCSWPRMWDWYERDISRIKRAIQERTWIIWYQRSAHDSPDCVRLVKSDVQLAWLPNVTATVKLNFYGGVTQHRFAFDCSQTTPTSRILTCDGWEPPTYSRDILSSQPGSGFLQFWTVSMTVRLDEPTNTEESIGPAHARHRLGIFGCSGSELGTVSVQGYWYQKNTFPDEREIILLCEGRDTRAKKGMADAEEGWRYRVMLIEWVLDSNGNKAYAERVGIGSIGKEDLDESLGDGPIWKEIILG